MTNGRANFLGIIRICLQLQTLNGVRIVATETKDDINAIRRHMAQIRRELHEDMQGVVAGAEAASDWRYYVRLYPWAALGAASAVGFLIVPRRRSVTRAAEAAAEDVVDRVQSVVKAAGGGRSQTVKQEKKKAGVVGALFGMALPIVTRAAQSYAAQYLENWIAQQGMLGPLAGNDPTPGPGAQPGPRPV
ncbi:MAG: hypothetical protein ABI353_11190 [Isosphaeraceae bacterium]